MQTTDPLGHDFDNDELVCACGTSFAAHQETRARCTHFAAGIQQPLDLDEDIPLAGLARAMGLGPGTIAKQCGLSYETTRRALHGETGGRGKTSPATAARVAQFVHDIAGDDK